MTTNVIPREIYFPRDTKPEAVLRGKFMEMRGRGGTPVAEIQAGCGTSRPKSNR